MGGQLFSLLLTLLATPVVYSLLDDVSLFIARKRARISERDASLDPTSAPMLNER